MFTEPLRFALFVRSKLTHLLRSFCNDDDGGGGGGGVVLKEDICMTIIILRLQVVWFYNKTTRLSTSDRLSLEERKGGGQTLTLHKLSYNDFGLYTCR